MVLQGILNYVLLFSLLSGVSFASTYGDVSEFPIVESGFGFSSSQSVSGVGFASMRACINADPEILKIHNSNSGHYRYESTIRLINFTATDPGNGFTSAGRSIELLENTSFTYSPSSLPAYGGTLRSGPIKSLLDDSITAGNGGGAFMKVGFDNTRVLSRDLHTKVSGFESVADIYGSSGRFDAGMKFNAAFTGDENLGVSLKGPNEKTPTRLIDEYYSGTYKMTKNLGITVSSSIWDYGETSEASNAISWLPCCSGGYLDMDLTDQRYHSAKDFFNCTSCEAASPCSNISASL